MPLEWRHPSQVLDFKNQDKKLALLVSYLQRFRFFPISRGISPKPRTDTVFHISAKHGRSGGPGAEKPGKMVGGVGAQTGGPEERGSSNCGSSPIRATCRGPRESSHLLPDDVCEGCHQGQNLVGLGHEGA